MSNVEQSTMTHGVPASIPSPFLRADLIFSSATFVVSPSAVASLTMNKDLGRDAAWVWAMAPPSRFFWGYVLFRGPEQHHSGKGWAPPHLVIAAGS